jgi:twitching motility protein PilU
MDLSLNLKAMIAQQLLPRLDGQGRVPVMEVLLNSPLIADHIRSGKHAPHQGGHVAFHGAGHADPGPVAAREVPRSARSAAEEAIRCADSANEVRLGIKMFDKQKGVDSRAVNLQVDG